MASKRENIIECSYCEFSGTRAELIKHVKRCEAAREAMIAERKAKDLAGMIKGQDPYADSRRFEGRHEVRRSVRGGSPGLRKRK